MTVSLSFMNKNCDIAVIGAGPGGYVAAIRASQLNAKVVLIEKSEVGGVCLNRGCIPTKSIYASAELLSKIKKASSFGISVPNYELNMAEVITRKNRIVRRLASGVKALINKNKIELITGEAVLQSPNAIKVSSGDIIEAKKIIIATGSSSANIPNFPIDKKRIITSDEALEMPVLPKDMTIIGGGVIGVEFANIFNEFGVKVTIVEMLPSILPLEEEEISAELTKELQSRGIEILTNKRLSSPDEISSEKILVAVGRVPNVSGLGLENANIQFDVRKGISVNEKMETSNPNIYAIGDVTGKILLAHVASHQGMAAAENAAGGNCEMHYDLVPNCIFTSPEIASAGLTEEKARCQFKNIKTGKFPFMGIGKAACIGEQKGFVKMIADADDDKVLGVHIIGPHATNLIAEACAVMKFKGTINDMADMIHAHPTLPEALMETAFVLRGTPIHI